MGAFSFLNKEIAIDLGTANTIISYTLVKKTSCGEKKP